jgi:hypothetical protein
MEVLKAAEARTCAFGRSRPAVQPFPDSPFRRFAHTRAVDLPNRDIGGRGENDLDGSSDEDVAAFVAGITDLADE